jgi:hypothetical protein
MSSNPEIRRILKILREELNSLEDELYPEDLNQLSFEDEAFAEPLRGSVTNPRTGESFEPMEVLEGGRGPINTRIPISARQGRTEPQYLGDPVAAANEILELLWGTTLGNTGRVLEADPVAARLALQSAPLSVWRRAAHAYWRDSGKQTPEADAVFSGLGIYIPQDSFQFGSLDHAFFMTQFGVQIHPWVYPDDE